MSDLDRTQTIKNETELEVMKQHGQRVLNIVSGERNKCYGTPSENHSVTGAMWALFLSRKWGFDVEITGSDVCWLNQLQKASRQAHRPQDDNAVDVAGYALNSLACDYAEREAKKSTQDVSVQKDNDRGSPELSSPYSCISCGTEIPRNHIKLKPICVHCLPLGSERILTEEAQANRFPIDPVHCERVPEMGSCQETAARSFRGNY